jgi:hypothetical protein
MSRYHNHMISASLVTGHWLLQRLLRQGAERLLIVDLDVTGAALRPARALVLACMSTPLAWDEFCEGIRADHSMSSSRSRGRYSSAAVLPLHLPPPEPTRSARVIRL